MRLQWAEWKHLVCAVLGLHAWMFGVSSSLSLTLSHSHSLSSLWTLLLVLLSLCLSVSLFWYFFFFFFLWWSLLSVMCRIIFLCVHHCILPYLWANSLALVMYHCHPLNFKNCHLKTGYNGRDFLSPINLLLQGILLGFFPGILCMNFVLCIARVLFIF